MRFQSEQERDELEGRFVDFMTRAEQKAVSAAQQAVADAEGKIQGLFDNEDGTDPIVTAEAFVWEYFNRRKVLECAQASLDRAEKVLDQAAELHRSAFRETVRWLAPTVQRNQFADSFDDV